VTEGEAAPDITADATDAADGMPAPSSGHTRIRWSLVLLVSVAVGVLTASVAPNAATAAGLIAGVVTLLAQRAARNTAREGAPSPIPLRADVSSAAGPSAPLRRDADADRSHLEYARDLIDAAASEGVLDLDARDRLLWFLAWRQASVTGAGASEQGSIPPVPAQHLPAPPARPAPQSGSVEGPETAGVAAPPQDGTRPAPPSTVQDRIGRLRGLIASDVAVHGLAYLGVLLLFSGSLGFMLFSFGSVRVGFRPVAEFSMPAVLLGSAWFLRRRRAPFVATALGLLGGLLLPTALFASLVDGVAFPPEVHGTALAATLVLVALGLALAYGLYGWRHPDASLRFLVAPMLWLAFWALGFVIAPATPHVDLRRWSAGQMSVVAVGIALTLALSRLRPGWRLDRELQVVAPFGIAISYALTMLFAGVEGWPTGPVVAAGLASLATAEMLERRIGGRDVVALVEATLLVSTSSALVAPIGIAWAGAALAIASIVLLEWQRSRDARVIGLAAPAATLLIGLGLSAVGLSWVDRGLEIPSVDGPMACVVAFGIASVWSHARRFTSLGDVSRRALRVAAVILPYGLAAGMLDSWPDDRALLVLSTLLAGLAVVQRAWLARDELYRWWIPVTAFTLVVAMATVVETQQVTWTLASSALLVSFALALTRWSPPAAVWTSAAALLWTGELVRRLVGWDVSRSGIVLAVAGVLVMLIATILPTRAFAPHASAVAVAFSATALALVEGDAHRLVGIGAWSAVWLVVVVGNELVRAPLIELAVMAVRPERRARTRRWLSGGAAVILGVSVPFAVASAGRAIGLLAGHRAWTGVAMSILAIVYAAAARPCSSRRPLGSIAATSAFALSLVGVSIAVPDSWPTILALTTPIVVTLVIGDALRRPVMTWVAWSTSAVLALLLGARAGLHGHDLTVVLSAWGVACCAGGLAVDDALRGRRRTGEGIRTPWLVPPVVLGALAVPAGVGFLADEPSRAYASWSLAAAGFYAVVAALLRAGSVTVASYGLLTFAVAVLIPADPYSHPWMSLPWCGALIALSAVLTSAVKQRDPWLRWDVAPLVIAHGVALVALARAVDIDEIPVTWVGFGVLALVLVVLRRNVAWALAAVALVNVGAAAAGAGWVALSLGATGVAAALMAARAVDPVRTALQLAATGAIAGAWWQLLVWRRWEVGAEVVSTAATAAALLLAASIAVRWRRLAVDWLASSGALALAGLAASAILATDRLGAHRADSVIAFALATLAASSAILARPLAAAWLRDASAVLAAAAIAFTGATWGIGVGRAVQAAAAVGVITMLIGLAIWRGRPTAAWLRALAIFSTEATAGAVLLALWAWPRVDLLETALVVAGLQSAVLGVMIRRSEPLVAAPVLLCSAWLLFASRSLTGETQWFTVPIGIATLVVVSVIRDARRGGDRLPVDPVIVALDLAGMTFLVGASLVETLSVSPLRGLLAIGLGTVIMGWGALTQVRRRAAFGVATVVLAVALLLVAPVARIVPAIHGAAVWAALVVAGIVFIAAASGLERGRATVNAVVRRLSEVTRGWE
jgi:hypothetical protein